MRWRWTFAAATGRFGTRLIKTHMGSCGMGWRRHNENRGFLLCGDFSHGETTSTSKSVCDAAHENSSRLMWRGLAPAIMKTLWAGVRGWVAVVRRAGAWVGGHVGGWKVGRGF